MGMYTGLQGTIKVNDLYTSYFDLVFIEQESFEEINLPLTEATKVFIEDKYNSSIPFGSLSYMPDEWKFGYGKNENGYYLCCGLKNHNRTIEKFLNFLNEIKAEYYIEVLYEEDESPTIYTNKSIT